MDTILSIFTVIGAYVVVCIIIYGAAQVVWHLLNRVHKHDE